MAGRRILVFAEWFLPGYKAGGPITSVANFVQQLKGELEIFVFTTDRDLGDAEAYPGIVVNRWLSVDGYKVYYTSPGQLSRQLINDTIEKLGPDVVYLNSMYSLYFTIFPLLKRRAAGGSYRIVLSPRGMLRRSALAIKATKKRIFLFMCRLAGISRKVEFLATDPQEAEDVRAIFGPHTRVEVLGNLPGIQPAFIPPPAKMPGAVQLIFVGRIHPIKNLLFLLEACTHSRVSIALSIVGPMEDPLYWKRCQDLIAGMEGRLTVTYLESVEKSKVISLLQAHHAFVLPTAGENFGHAIVESLGAGRPVLISDQTPWRNLAKDFAGWDLPLTSPEQFALAIDDIGAMGQDELNQWCNGAWRYCEAYMKRADLRHRYLQFFDPS